jgi:hypothetical protein
MFHAVYSTNLTTSEDADMEVAVLSDMVDGWSANVYQLGCGRPPCSLTGGHCPPLAPGTAGGNLVLNGDFESVELSRPSK